MKKLFLFLIILVNVLSGFSQTNNHPVKVWFGMNSQGQPVVDDMPYAYILPQFSTPVATFTTLTSATISASNVETTLIGTVNGSTTLSAANWYPGKTYIIKLSGVYSAPAAALVANLTIKVYIGSTSITLGTASNLLALASGLPFYGEITVICRATGISGYLSVSGYINFSVGTGVTPVAVLYAPNPLINVNTTVDNILNITGTYSTGTTGNSITSVNVICTPVN